MTQGVKELTTKRDVIGPDVYLGPKKRHLPSQPTTIYNVVIAILQHSTKLPLILFILEIADLHESQRVSPERKC